MKKKSLDSKKLILGPFCAVNHLIGERRWAVVQLFRNCQLHRTYCAVISTYRGFNLVFDYVISMLCDTPSAFRLNGQF